MALKQIVNKDLNKDLKGKAEKMHLKMHKTIGTFNCSKNLKYENCFFLQLNFKFHLSLGILSLASIN